MNQMAMIDPKSKLAKDVEVGPWSIIGPDVIIGEGTKIGSHVVIQGPTKIGANNEIHAFSSIGADSQDKKFHGEVAYLEIGDHNIFREYTSVHRGTKDGGSITKIGHHNLFMNYVHIAHDCIIGSHNTLSNNATLAGHVHLGDYVTMGGLSAVHQFVKIGDHAFIAGRCGVYMDVIPYVLVGGDQGHLLGLNTIGLKRRQFLLNDIKQIKKHYQTLFCQGHLLTEAITSLQQHHGQCLFSQTMLDFIKQSSRGLLRPRQQVNHHVKVN